MKKYLLLLFSCQALWLSAQTYSHTTYTSYNRPTVKMIEEEVPDSAIIVLQAHMEIGCQFTKAKFENTPFGEAYQPHSFWPAGFDGDFSIGIRATRFVFVGVGVGAHSEYALKETLQDTPDGPKISLSYFDWEMPVYGDVRLYVPTQDNMDPFVEGQVGGFFGLDGECKIDGVEQDFKKPGKGFYWSVGAGIDFRRFMVSAGYREYRCNSGADLLNTGFGYVKIGVRLGRNLAFPRYGKAKK